MNDPQRPRISLTFWQSAGSLDRFRQALDQWWDQVQAWISQPTDQMNPDTCELALLDLIAWGRGLDRLPHEPEARYRKRVKHAYSNALDAGSVAGFRRIMARLGLGQVEIEQRPYGQDWDVIILYLSNKHLSENMDQLMALIQRYGRTCRRYRLAALNEPIDIRVLHTEFGSEQQQSVAILP